jgi:hypothetical protein
VAITEIEKLQNTWLDVSVSMRAKKPHFLQLKNSNRGTAAQNWRSKPAKLLIL